MPARYVGGYLAPSGGVEEHAAGHAWASALVPDLGWVSFDPANAVSATDHYVGATLGLDYADVAPVRGVRQGGGVHIGETGELLLEGKTQFGQLGGAITDGEPDGLGWARVKREERVSR